MGTEQLNHGLLHEDLFFETNGEFFFVWERLNRKASSRTHRGDAPDDGAILHPSK